MNDTQPVPQPARHLDVNVNYREAAFTPKEVTLLKQELKDLVKRWARRRKPGDSSATT